MYSSCWFRCRQHRPCCSLGYRRLRLCLLFYRLFLQLGFGVRTTKPPEVRTQPGAISRPSTGCCLISSLAISFSRLVDIEFLSVVLSYAVMISSGIAPEYLRGSSGTCSECCLYHHRASYRVTHGCNIKLRAAFSSLSRWAPQWSQWYVLTFGGMASLMCPQVEHRFVLGKYFGALIW